MNVRTTLIAGMFLCAFSSWAENAIENVERRTADALKIDRSLVGEWVADRGLIATVGVAALENKTPEEIVGKRHELVEIAIVDAKLKLAEKLGFSLCTEEKRQLWGDSAEDLVGATTSSRIQFIAKHRIYGATVLVQSESSQDGEYLMAVSLVWSKGLQKSAETIMSGRGKAKTDVPGKNSLGEWLESGIDTAQVVGPRQYVDNEGKRHFLGIVAMPWDEATTPAKKAALRRVLQIKGAMTVVWSLRSDVETSSISETVLKQVSSGELDAEDVAEVSRKLTQRINQRFRGAIPPVRPLFKNGFIYRKHPLFPDVTMAIYACELDGEFSAYVDK